MNYLLDMWDRFLAALKARRAAKAAADLQAGAEIVAKADAEAREMEAASSRNYEK